MLFDFGVGIVDEDVGTIGEFDGVFLCVLLPVAMIDPLPPFSRMAKPAPFGQFIVPLPSRTPALRQHIPSITLGLGFLGHPTPPGLRLGCLLKSP